MWIPRWLARWAVKTLIRKSSTVLDKHRLVELADEGTRHSRDFHHDGSIHTDCEECMRICGAIVDGFGLTPEQSVAELRRTKSKFTHISEALMQRQSAPLGRSEEKEKIH